MDSYDKHVVWSGLLSCVAQTEGIVIIKHSARQLSRSKFTANQVAIAQIDKFCAKTGLVKNGGVNLDPFWASLEALVALIVFLVPCLS